MDYNWKAAVKGAKSPGAGSSGRLSGFDNVKFWREGNLWKYQNHNRKVESIDEWEDIPVDSIHFRPIGNANYAKLNALDETIVDEMTKSIMRGDVKITGPYSCVNNVGDPPVAGCLEIAAPVPVPIRRQEEPIYAKLSKVKVTRGSSSWYIYQAHIEESTSSGGGREKMEKNRIYMCGGL